MRQALRAIALLIAVGALTGGSVAFAHDGGGNGHGHGAFATTIFTMGAEDGPPEGVAFDKKSGRFFVSRTGTGAIFAGTLDSDKLQPFIPGGAPGTAPLATGLKVRDGLLYVAGASTGEIRVYDLADPTKAPIVFETGGGFINDLDLTPNGDVYATDSFKPAIYKVSAESVKAGTGPVETIDVAPEITVDTTPGVFNLNGIVAKNDHELIVVQSNTGKLYRITLGADVATRTIEEIEVDGGPLTGGDGLLLDRGRLLVVRGANAVVDVVKLRHHRTEGEVVKEITDDSFTGPSTIARAKNLLLVVNANFAGAETAKEFTVTGLARKAADHRGHGHGDKTKDDEAKDKADNSGHGNAGDKDDKAKDDNSGHGNAGDRKDDDGGH
jgi:sugar lactone lactonase YvrE